MNKEDEYKKGLQIDKEAAREYYRKSIVKTEQQKLLEQLLREQHSSTLGQSLNIADIACGGGTLSFHLSDLFTDSSFHLVDYNEDAISNAREINSDKRFSFSTGDIYSLDGIEDNSFDFVFCWQTLSWLEHPEKALKSLLRILKPGGSLFASSLFNLDHDVDIYAKVYDHTRESGKNNIGYNYNTYSRMSVEKWVSTEVSEITFHKFHPSIDFNYTGRGIGTYTIPTDSHRLQFSSGMLLNWAILKIKK